MIDSNNDCPDLDELGLTGVVLKIINRELGMLVQYQLEEPES
jgi:hypothetical protein